MCFKVERALRRVCRRKGKLGSVRAMSLNLEMQFGARRAGRYPTTSSSILKGRLESYIGPPQRFGEVRNSVEMRPVQA